MPVITTHRGPGPGVGPGKVLPIRGPGIEIPAVGASFTEYGSAGHITNTAITFKMALTAPEATVQLFASINSDMSNPVAAGPIVASVTKTFTTAPTSQDIVEVSVDGLSPNTAYFFAFSDGTIIDPFFPRLKTFPSPGTPVAFSHIGGSCSDFTFINSNSDVYLEMRDIQDAYFFSHRGDMHYSDNTTVATVRADNNDDIRNWMSQTKVQAMLFGNSTAHGGNLGDLGKGLVYQPDDHDFFGGDNASLSTANYAAGALEVLMSYEDMIPHYPFTQPVPGAPYARGFAQSFNLGDVHYAIADCKTFLGSHESAGYTILGNGQTVGGSVTFNGLNQLKSDILAAVPNSSLNMLLITNRWQSSSPVGFNTASDERALLADFIATLPIENLLVYADMHGTGYSDGIDANQKFTDLGFVPSVTFSPFASPTTTFPPATLFNWNSIDQRATTNEMFGRINIDTTSGVDYDVLTIDEFGATILGPISNSDVIPSVSIVNNNVGRDEGSVGIKISRTDWFGASSFTFTTSDNTAIAGVDYTATTGTGTFAPNAHETVVNVPITNSATSGAVDFKVTLSAPVDCTITVDSATVIIADATADIVQLGSPNFTETKVANSDLDTISIPLPATPLENDLIVLAWIRDSDWVFTGPAGYVELFDLGDNVPSFKVWYKVSGVSEPDPVLSTSVVTGTNHTAGCIAMVFRNVDPVNPIDNGFNQSSLSSNLPHPPPHFPATNRAMHIVAAGLDDDNVLPVTAPSGYSNLSTIGHTSGSGHTGMVASKIGTTAQLDVPDAFGGTGNDEWHAIHFALRKARVLV